MSLTSKYTQLAMTLEKDEVQTTKLLVRSILVLMSDVSTVNEIIMKQNEF